MDTSAVEVVAASRRGRWNKFRLRCNNDDALAAILVNQKSHLASLHQIQKTLDERYNLQPYQADCTVVVPPPRRTGWNMLNVFKIYSNTDDILATVIQNQDSHQASISKTEKTLEHLYTLKLFKAVSCNKNPVVGGRSTNTDHHRSTTITDRHRDDSTIKIFTRNHERSSHQRDGLVLNPLSDGGPEKAKKDEASKQ